MIPAKLTLVSTSPLPREFLIHAELLKHGEKIGKKRRYMTLDSALTKTDAWLRRDGATGSQVVIFHARSGMELGFIKLTTKGSIIKRWVWEE